MPALSSLMNQFQPMTCGGTSACSLSRLEPASHLGFSRLMANEGATPLQCTRRTAEPHCVRAAGGASKICSNPAPATGTNLVYWCLQLLQVASSQTAQPSRRSNGRIMTAKNNPEPLLLIIPGLLSTTKAPVGRSASIGPQAIAAPDLSSREPPRKLSSKPATIETGLCGVISAAMLGILLLSSAPACRLETGRRPRS